MHINEIHKQKKEQNSTQSLPPPSLLKAGNNNKHVSHLCELGIPSISKK